MNTAVSSASCSEWTRGWRGAADVSPLLIPEGLMPEGRGELDLRSQPMIERSSYRFAFLLPDEIGAHRDFIFGCFRTSLAHMLFAGPIWFAASSNQARGRPGRSIP
jgi:hypothetical protein